MDRNDSGQKKSSAPSVDCYIGFNVDIVFHMNSTWPTPNLPKPGPVYSQKDMFILVAALEQTLERLKSRGLVEAQNINISNLPTSATGLRVGDLWNDGGTVKVA